MQIPPPPAPPSGKLPPKAWSMEPRPQAHSLPPPPQRGLLYIRGDDSFHETMTRSLTLITLCPTSMEFLMYLNAVKLRHNGAFDFQTNFITDGEAPRFETEESTYNNVNELNESDTPLSLEPRIAEMQRPILEQMQIEKQGIMDALTKIRNALLFGYRLFCQPDTEWVIRDLNNIRTQLVQQMKEACKFLSSKLGKDRYFMDTLSKTFNIKTEGHELFSLSILDIQLAASGSLIRKCFEIEEVSPYATEIRTILYGYISLWAHNDIIYSWFIKGRIEPLDFTATLVQNPGLLATTFRERAQASGAHGDVYKVSIVEDNNVWGLNINDYAFKVSNEFLTHINKSEAHVLAHIPYENIIKIVGKGTGELNNKKVCFFVMKWISGGSLYDRMEGLNLSQVKKILKGTAYALHLLYTSTRSCVVDLKPQNILLDENDDPILCDFGLFAVSGQKFEGESDGTPLYHDDSSEASHDRDIFAYGVIIFQLLTNEVHEMHNGVSFASKINRYVDEDMDLGTLIKPRLQHEADWAVFKGGRCYSHQEELDSPQKEVLSRFLELSMIWVMVDFLFEFASKINAEQVMKGRWHWKNKTINFWLWLPVIGGLLKDTSSTVWTRIIAIGDHCGDWVKLEEETKLRNHLKLARIRVEGDGRGVPKEVTLKHGGLLLYPSYLGEITGKDTNRRRLTHASDQQISRVLYKRLGFGKIQEKRRETDHMGTSSGPPNVWAQILLDDELFLEPEGTESKFLESIKGERYRRYDHCRRRNKIRGRVNSNVLELSNNYGRQITYDLLIAKKGSDALLGKLDIEKAFDQLNWSNIISILRQMGFGERVLKQKSKTTHGNNKYFFACMKARAGANTINVLKNALMKHTEIQQEILSYYKGLLGEIEPITSDAYTLCKWGRCSFLQKGMGSGQARSAKLLLSPIPREDIMQALKDMPRDKAQAPGIDGFPMKFSLYYLLGYLNGGHVTISEEGLEKQEEISRDSLTKNCPR
ncbi:hypothetical protein H5410_034992 [Solanum commersonii]|uniref:Protein kinase domain-containing protein n=1 Tax=Solanum commersonii TaxID=4109 RepID=A0A9J5Y2J2_SOLCO|nr:hypothetical protein H5410_034992 [Solanum commersonii]